MFKRLAQFALGVLVVGLLYLLVSGNLLSPSPLVIAAQLSAIGLAGWARRSFQPGQFSIHAEPKAGPRLATGPYRTIRHLMYAAALLLLWASILGHWSLIPVIVGLLITCEVALRITVEEQLLRASFSDYTAYAQTTKRLIPFILKAVVGEGKQLPTVIG
ncbi:MAG: hypothetical protein R2932_29040 [Caldilineaceae bacterium]